MQDENGVGVPRCTAQLHFYRHRLRPEGRQTLRQRRWECGARRDLPGTGRPGQGLGSGGQRLHTYLVGCGSAGWAWKRPGPGPTVGAERGGATIPHLARGGVQTWTGRGLMGTGWGLGQAGTLTQPWHPAGPSGCVPPCGQPHLPSGSLRPRPQRASSIRACGPCPWWVPEYRRTATSGLQRQTHLSPLGSSLAPNREAYPHLQQRWAGRSSKEVGSMGRPGFKSPLHQVLLSNPQLHPHNTPSSVSTGLIYKV